MLFINYKGNIPQQRFYSFAVKGNHNANKVRFVLARKQADIDLTNYVCNLKVENKETHCKDLIMLDLVKESESELVFEWTMSNKSTQFRNIELQLEFLSTENESEVVWQTMIVEFELSETIKVGDERPTDKELSVLKQVEAEVKSYDNRITKNTRDIEALQEEVETKDNIIIGNPEEYLNEQGLKKIIRPVDDNGNVNKSFMIDKIHHESTVVEANADTSYDGNELDGGSFKETFGENDFRTIFGEQNSINDCGAIYTLYYDQSSEITKGARFGLNDFNSYGSLEIEDCTPNQVIRVIVGKYFEYDEHGNKVFDEHSVIFSDCFASGSAEDYREITEERQVFELKVRDNGYFYFDSDGGDFGNTRFILYGFETGEPAYDEYEPKELGSGTAYFETTYAELKQLRDNSKLVKGALYRITDYVTTTTQEETRSAGHQFDIIVQAIDINILDENARAINHSGDTYFESCNLNAWEIKYCLDNNTTRFAWADEENGKGVIYYMKDEWNNECPYDFKNIQFKRYMIDTCEKVPSLEGNYLGIKRGQGYTIDTDDFIWNYTFTWVNENDEVEDCSIVGQTLINDEGQYSGVFNNKIASVSAFSVIHSQEPESFQFALNSIVIQATYGYEDGTFYGIHGNTFGNNCSNNTFGNNCSGNTFGNDCLRNTFGDYCSNNTFGNNCSGNKFGNEYYNNRFGNNCSNNTSGSGFVSNAFGNDCLHNTFGDYCYYNAFGNECSHNTFGNDCSRNTFGNDCGMNTFGDSSSPMGSYRHNIIDAGCSQIYLVANGTANYLQNVHIHLGVNNKTITVDRGLDYETNIVPAETTTMEV